MIPEVESIPESDFGHFLEFSDSDSDSSSSGIELIPIWNRFHY